MTKLSKVVRERLKVTAAAMAAHPDADLLTAFVERSLAERERAGVMEHLARCGDCREIVTLALPAEVEEVVAAKGGVRGNWFRLPALRWAAVAVGIAVAVSVGTLEYRSQPMRSFSANLARNQEKQEVVAALRQPAPFEAQKEAITPPSEQGKKVLTKKSTTASAGFPAELRLDAQMRPSSSGALAGSRGAIAGAAGAGAGAPTAAGRELATMNAAKSLAPPSVGSAQAAAPAPARPPVPQISEEVEVSGASAMVETEQAEVSSDKVGRAKAPASQQIVNGAPSLPTQGRNVADLEPLSPSKVAPRWTIAANGALQRSFDGGTSWQDVNVTGDASMNANFTARAKTSEGAKAGRKFADAAIPVFRALAVNGAEVWAGGASGALYHTVDAGNSWARVVPSYVGVGLGGDIIHIDFPDPQHGRISTSTGEVWTTGDGGQTWQKLK